MLSDDQSRSLVQNYQSRITYCRNHIFELQEAQKDLLDDKLIKALDSAESELADLMKFLSRQFGKYFDYEAEIVLGLRAKWKSLKKNHS